MHYCFKALWSKQAKNLSNDSCQTDLGFSRNFWSENNKLKCLLSPLNMHDVHLSLWIQSVKFDREYGYHARCLKIPKNVSFNIATEASYVFILCVQKFIKIAKNSPILPSSWKPEACDQRVLPDRKFKLDIFGDFQTTWWCQKHGAYSVCMYFCEDTWCISNYHKAFLVWKKPS